MAPWVVATTVDAGTAGAVVVDGAGVVGVVIGALVVAVPRCWAADLVLVGRQCCLAGRASGSQDRHHESRHQDG